MVRAPPCHGGSCGFEPRLPRIFFAVVIFILTGCTSINPQDFKEEAQKQSQLLVSELQKIRTRDDLLLHVNELENCFNKIADVMIRAREYHQSYPESDFNSIVPSDPTINDQLSTEMNRILHMEGGREVLLKVQEKALFRIKMSLSKNGLD